MINTFNILILAPIFIVVLVVAFKALQPALGLGRMHSFILAVCVSMLAVIGIVRYLGNSVEMLLLPYAALGIAILLLLLFLFIGKFFKDSKDRQSNRTIKKNVSESNDKWLRRSENGR